MDHGRATVRFEQYRPVLEMVIAVLPPQSNVTLLADRGVEHGELVRWLRRHDWSWAIPAKYDLQVRLAIGTTSSMEKLLPPSEQAYLFERATVLGDIACHLAVYVVHAFTNSISALVL